MGLLGQGYNFGGIGGTGLSLEPTAGMTGWWKANTLALSDTDPVTTWADSANSNDLTSAGANRPTYLVSQKNGLPAVDFDGGVQYLDVAIGSLTQPTTVFIVFKQNTWTDNMNIFDSHSFYLMA